MSNRFFNEAANTCSDRINVLKIKEINDIKEAYEVPQSTFSRIEAVLEEKHLHVGG
jgi:hypothetical protein